MKIVRLLLTTAVSSVLCCFSSNAQLPMLPHVPIWDANTVNLQLHKITENVYAVLPSTADAETTKGIPQATTAGFIVGDKGVLLIETMLNKRLYDQLYKLVRSVTSKPVVYAVNTSDHGDHCFGNYLLPAQTLIIQNEYCKANLEKNFSGIQQFMIGLFGKGRGMEDVKYRAADITIAKDQQLKLDLGHGITVELVNTGTAQSPADLFVFIKTPQQKVAWLGNPFIAESPTIPWLFDGYFLEPVANLKKIYDRLADDDIIVPGHGRITSKKGIGYTIEYVNALQQQVQEALKAGLTLEQTQAKVTMKEYDRGYELFHWLHVNFNIPNAYKDIKANTAATSQK
jgi:glyoxylase-like metal-dependent hydrolase (beta-lactamase superfamily II)